jgi:hypothetical protein
MLGPVAVPRNDEDRVIAAPSGKQALAAMKYPAHSSPLLVRSTQGTTGSVDMIKALPFALL